jgi:hypothetical protein
MALANVALTDTFDVWRIRTNQLIVQEQLTFNFANAAYNQANSVAIGANAWTNTAVAGANAWTNTAVAGANAWSNTKLSNTTTTLDGTLTVTGGIITPNISTTTNVASIGTTLSIAANGDIFIKGGVLNLL